MRRSKWALLAAFAALVCAGCNGDDDGGGGTKPPPGTIEVKPGRWFVQVSAQSSNQSCTSLAAFVASTDSVTICDNADPEDFLGGLDCGFSVNANTVTVDCEGSQTYLGCNLAYDGNATGTFNSDRSRFTLALPVQVVATNPQACGGELACTISVTLVATWVHDGGCTGGAPSLEAAVGALLAPLGNLSAPQEPQ